MSEPAPTAPTAPPPSAGPPPVPDAAVYHRIKRILHVGDVLLSVAYWAAWCGLGPGWVAWLASVVDSPWAGMFLSALAMLGGFVVLTLPLAYYEGFLLERRFHLTNQTPRSWLVFQIKSWLVGGVLMAVVLGGLYGLLWYAGRGWSLWVWVGLLTLTVVVAKLFPLVILPIFYPARPLDRPVLAERLHRLAEGTGLTLTGVFDLALSKDTRKANAMLAGLGSSRRVYLSDTLLEAFSEEQIGVVFAHELGHHIHGHVWKLIALSAAATSVMVGLIHWRLDPFAGRPQEWAQAVAALPQVLLIATLWPLLIGPITNAVSRSFERQCDREALRLTNDPAAYRGAFELLARMNLADPDPPRWEVILFHDHPPISQRIALAETHVVGD